MTDSIENSIESLDPETIKNRLNRDTAKIQWSALCQFDQLDSIVQVDAELDLIEVACEFARDNTAQVRTWLDQSAVRKISPETEKLWQSQDPKLWAVVVSPWILVQDKP